MTRTSTRITGAAIAAMIATTAHAETDPQATLAEVFNPNRIATFVANSAIAAARTRMELRYDHLSTDLMRGTATISGIVARPILPYDRASQCEVTIDRAVLSSDLARPFDVSAELTLNMIGATASLACFERDIALGLRTAGFKDVALDQFKMRVSYVYTTGETATDMTVAINNFATLDFSASGTILPRPGTYGLPGDPAVRISRAVLSLKDDGAWAAVATILPENLRDPATVRELGTEAVLQFLSDGGLRSLSAVERNFVADLMARVEEYVTDPGEITIEADLPPTGIVIEPEQFDAPQDLIAAMALRARTVPLARTRILSGDVLAGLQNPDTLTPESRLALGLALLNGQGVPQGGALVPALLEPLTADPATAGRAAALIAQALQDSDPDGAYRYALIAAARIEPGAVAQLDRLEGRMTTTAVWAAQRAYLDSASVPAPLTQITGEDPRELRALALASFTGSGAPRSYARAYYFALLAEAAGDIAATSLREEIAARFNARGDAVTTLWQTESAAIQAQALNDWISADLPARYRRD